MTIADPVCAFYTSHPYPPPVENLDRARDEWQHPSRHRAEHHLLWPARPYQADLDILVAGCGTWQAAKYALCRPAARVAGIDVSAASIEHTATLQLKYNLTNLELRQLPIEQVDALERRFDLIVCTGVLHHLADPDAGLRALRSVLRPNGAMYLMVYAPFGRAGIHLLQDYCRKLGIGTSEEDIHELAAVVDALPPQHPLVALLRSSRDRLDARALADALLNPRERSYSVPQLFEFLERNGLAFRRWYWQAPYLHDCGAMAATAHASRLAELPGRECFALMELWRGTMTAHSVIASRSDAIENAGPVFDDDRWPDYIPVRLPHTLCVAERLPAGAAGVLLNRSHPFHDLILAVDATEKRLFDAIDGRLSIREIGGAARVDRPSDVRALFERLWRYDQVVFDTSAPAGARG